MANNLLDAIRGNSLPQQQGVTDETSKLQRLLRAKSGRDISGPDVGSSNLGEQQAVAQTNQTLTNQVAPQIDLQRTAQEQQAQTQESEFNTQKQSIDQARSFNTLESKMKTNSLLSDLERGKGQMDLAREKAATNQLAVNLRFQNTKYVDDLQREGAKNRLNNQLDFEQALTNSILGDNQQLLEKQLGGKSILSADNRDFNGAMARMGLDDAYAMFRSDVKSGKQRALYTGLGNVVTAGVGAAGKMSGSGTETAADNTQTTNTSGGWNDMPSSNVMVS